MSRSLDYWYHELWPIPWPKQPRRYRRDRWVVLPTTATVAGPWERTNKTISWKRPSISLIQNKNFDFICPHRLSIEISQEMFWRMLSNFKMGTLAWATNCNLRHPPAARCCQNTIKEVLLQDLNHQEKQHCDLMLLLFSTWKHKWKNETNLVSLGTKWYYMQQKMTFY